MGIFKKFLQSIKKNWVVLFLCASIVSASYTILFYHYRTFSFAGANDFVYKIESYILDYKIRIRGPIKPSNKLGVLAIDEKTIQSFGTFPFSRKYYSKAFKNLKKLGVKWVGFDAIFAEEQKTILSDVSKDIKNLSANNSSGKLESISNINKYLKVSHSDLYFSNAIKSFENIVLGYFYFGSKVETELNLGKRNPYLNLESILVSEIEGIDMPEGLELNTYSSLSKAHGVMSNTNIYAESSPYFGFFSNNPDDDAINRWVTLVADANGHLMPSLALKTISEYMNREIFVLFDEIGVENIMLVNREDDGDVIEIPLDPHGSGRILVNHIGGSRGFTHYSLADAYHNTFTKKERKTLKGSALLLGATAIGTNDIRPNPFDPTIDGVENHLAVMDNILTQSFYKRTVDIYKVELLIVLGIGILFAPLMMYGSALTSGASVLLFIVGYFYWDKYAWFQNGIWAYMAIPMSEIVAMYISTTLYKFMVEEKEKRQVKGAFQHYLSPEVIDQVLDDPESLSLGGEKKELTVFFSDVRGFTTISESLSPEKLCELMNAYFTPMTGIILKNRGVLDKYIGDAIMAFWGAPVTLPNSPDIACQSSLEMLFALDNLKKEFKEKGLPDIDIGIGLNTGPMSVGNMGSAERLTYTVMGDSVNLGARLEGLTKEYGIKIMISEFTYAKITPGKFFTRDLDDIRVKGKNEPVKVFELMRPDFLEDFDQIREFIKLFEKGRTLYRTQHWDGSKKAFNDCLAMKSDDKASEVYIERIQNYLDSPPEENWSGVYTFTHK